MSYLGSQKGGALLTLAIIHSTLLTVGALTSLVVDVHPLCVSLSYLFIGLLCYTTHVVGHYRIFQRYASLLCLC